MIKRFHFLYLIFFSILFFPFVVLSSSAPALRPEWFIIILAIVILPVYTLSLKVAYWFLILIFSMIFSIVYGVTVLGVKLGMSDVFELLKPLLYFAFFTFASSVTLTPAGLTQFLKFSVLMFVSISLIAILQYFGGGPLLNAFLSLYTPAERIDFYVNSRATATMPNPNELGMLLTIGFALSVFSLDLKFPLKLNYAFPFILLFGVMASGSRTALLAMMIVTVYFFYQQKNSGRITFKSLIYLLTALGGISIIVLANAGLFSNTAYRLFLSSDDSASISWIARLATTIETLQLIRQSPIFGWGVNKLGFESGDNIDNEYILFLYRYGVIGLLAVLGVFGAMKSRVNKNAFEVGSLMYSYTFFLTAILLGAALFAYAAGIFHSFRLCTLIVVFLGIGAGLQKRQILNVNLSSPY